MSLKTALRAFRGELLQYEKLIEERLRRASEPEELKSLLIDIDYLQEMHDFYREAVGRSPAFNYRLRTG